MKTTRNWGDSEGVPESDWKPRRMGANPPATLAELRGQAFESVLSACGVPAELAVSGSQGTGQREAWRRFLHGTIQGASAVIAQELSAEVGNKRKTIVQRAFCLRSQRAFEAYMQMVSGGLVRKRRKAGGLGVGLKGEAMAKRKRKLVDVLDVERFEQAKAAIVRLGEQLGRKEKITTPRHCGLWLTRRRQGTAWAAT